MLLKINKHLISKFKMPEEEDFVLGYQAFDDLASFQEKWSQMKQKIHHAIHDNKDEVISFIEKTATERDSCVKITEDISALEQEKVSKMLKQESLRIQIEQMRKDVTLVEKRQNYLENKVKPYVEHLGMEIKPLRCKKEENRFETLFSFKRVSNSFQGELCSLVLVLQDDVYKVSECQPPVEDLDVMLRDLNETDDLSSFVINMRQKFCVVQVS